MELTLRSGRTTTLQNTPPSAPTQANFPGIFSPTAHPGTNAPSNSQASASTTATRPTAPAAQASTARPLAGYSQQDSWHTWGRLAEIMRQDPNKPSRGFAEIRKRSVPVMRKRRQAIVKQTKKVIKRKEVDSRQRLKNHTRNQIRKKAVADDPVYKRMTEVMGQPTSQSYTVPVRHVEEQLLKLGKGDAVTYRCCQCGKAGRQKQSIKGKEVEGRGGARCQCGHLLCMFCLHVETEEDELIDFEFMGLGDDEPDDEEGDEDGGDAGGMGGAGVTLEVAA